MKFVPILILILAACDGNGDPPIEPSVDSLRVQTVVSSGLSSPVHLTAPANDARLFVVEQQGRIRIIQSGQLLATPFLDISARVSCCGEQGLFSLAFHPAYATNGYFFVNFTDVNGDTRVERFRVSAGNPNIADPASSRLILAVDQPFENHNGGQIAFGPDGMLYIGMGDGGAGGDPLNHGQDRATLLGDLLRIDVNNGDPYAIPANNPYVGSTQFRPEIWAYGLRNPWRFSFDVPGGMLYVADVGQNAWEEINAVPATQSGINYGWRIMEGRHCYNTQTCSQTGLQLPVHEYDHSEGCSVTGGFVYRGSAIPGMVGHYFYSDFCEGLLRSFRLSNGTATDHRTWSVGPLGQVMSFGQDAAGELYILSGNGTVRRIVP
ncbi:MAG TPA: PQQ-dependent sugar dehydrogenase [Longimicrobiales bacterium]